MDRRIGSPVVDKVLLSVTGGCYVTGSLQSIVHCALEPWIPAQFGFLAGISWKNES